MKETTEILTLIDRFFEGETSLEEERWLYNYFAQATDLPEALASYREVFTAFGDLADTESVTTSTVEPRKAENLPTIELPISTTPPKHRRLWQTLSGIAASLVLVLGSLWAYRAYESQMLQNLYGGSYMIVDGQRIDNLREIRHQIEQTLSLADAIEAIPSAILIEQAEDDLLNHIQDASERERIRQLLNQ